MLSKLKLLTWRMRQLFKIGKAKQQQCATHMHSSNSSSSNSNNNCESENNNNVNSELSKLCLLLTNEMAENAANEWLLQQQATTPSTTIAYAEDMEPNVICVQTEAGHFYWNTNEQFNEIIWK